MDNHPLVSVIVPTCNRAWSIKATIESILRQTYANRELIVVDDRSSDDTQEIIESYASGDSRIRYVRNTRTKGPAGARNCGLSLALGELAAFLDSDDQWFETHLEESVAVIRETKSDVSFGLWVLRHNETETNTFEGSEEQKQIRLLKETFPVVGEAVVFEIGLLDYSLRSSRNFFHINTMVFKRELLSGIGLYNEELTLGEDSEFLLRFYDRCRIALHLKPHFMYFQSSDSIYYVCDRSRLDVDQIHLNEDVLHKLEDVELRSIAAREVMRNYLRDSSTTREKHVNVKMMDMGIARSYFTLGYLFRMNRKKAIRYTGLSLRYHVYMFNAVYYVRLLLSVNSASKRLRKELTM